MCIPIFAGVGVALGASASSAAAVGTMAVVSTVAAAASAAAAISSGIQQNKAAKANANYQRQSAISGENVAAQQAADQKLKARKIAATQAATAAAGGVDPTTGTPLQLETETAKYGELDALRITNNAQRQAWGMNTQADITEFQGSQAQTAGYMSGASSLLGGASNAYFGAMRFNQ